MEGQMEHPDDSALRNLTNEELARQDGWTLGLGLVRSEAVHVTGMRIETDDNGRLVIVDPGQIVPEPSQLDRIEAKLDRLLKALEGK
jgi:hypothetical protein